jgi:hypothetical protein
VRTRQVAFVAFGILWAIAVGAGLRILLNYETAAGPPTSAPAHWPRESRIARVSGKPTLVLLAHPHCPCTRASIGELAVLMARLQGQVSTHVLFYKPAHLGGSWEQTDLWRSAAAIPGVTVQVDEGGAEAARFGSAVSGQTLLYGADGRLLFSGGITASRGHFGDNDGSDAILSLVTRGSAERTETPAFGCSLQDPSTAVSKLDVSWER